MFDFIGVKPTASGSILQPHSVGVFPYRSRMGKSAAKTNLWENALALMNSRYGAENLSRLARETKIGPGSASRIKAQETSVGVDVLEKIAGNFAVEPWRLMAPKLGADLVKADAKHPIHLDADELAVVMALRAVKAATPARLSLASTAPPDVEPVPGATESAVRNARLTTRARHKTR